MELPALSFKKCFMFRREFPSRCNGVFRFDEVCTHCDYFLECMILRIAEFGCAGRPRTLLKDVLHTAFLFHKKVPPRMASYLARDIEPFAAQRSPKLKYAVKKQIKTAYAFRLYGDFIRGWKVRILKLKDKRHFYSCIENPKMYVDWMTGDQVLRVGLTARAIVDRLIREPVTFLSYEATGWCAYQISQIVKLRRVAFAWMPHPKGGAVRRAMKYFISNRTKDMQLPFQGFPYVSRKVILCLQVESDKDCLEWLQWIEKFRCRVVFVFAAFRQFRHFILSQCTMFPIGFYVAENTHYPYLAVFDVFNVSKLRQTNED